MLVIQFDRVHAKALERRVAGGADVLRPAVHSPEAAVGTAHVPELRRQDHLRAPARDGAAHELLVGERAVHVRRVQERDPQVERPLNRGDRLGVVATAVKLRHPHASQAEGRHLEALPAKRALLHVTTPSRSMGIRLGLTSQGGTRFRRVAGATLLPSGHTRRHDSLRSTTYTFRCAVGTMTISRMLTCSGRLTTYAIASAMSSGVSAWNPRYTALARAALSTPFRFVSIMRSQSSGSPSWILDIPLARPALLMRTSGMCPPATRLAAAVFTAARSRTSTCASNTDVPWPSRSSALSRSSRSTRRAHSTSFAPSAAKRRAHAAPIPELAPVIRLSFPSIRLMRFTRLSAMSLLDVVA